VKGWHFTPYCGFGVDILSDFCLFTPQYQAGVFISRSSGNMWTATITILWLMPFLQIVNLYFFWLDSLHHFWYNYLLMLPCFIAGLLGGSVYVQGFSRINLDMPIELKEFAIASAVIAMNLGILVADILSLFVQSCIFKRNGIEGAVVDCPVNM
jgi:battenin